ncbi:MAG: HIT domain-containing protein [Gemmatimonadota bacterium]|jgi:diadenosine tetraphosphate (Ap4A) HIT family hydrolase
MTTEPCPFCEPDEARVMRRTRHAFALSDAYPVSEGHTLVIPVRHVASVFNLSAEEQAEIWRLAIQMRTDLTEHHQPDGFNIGVNDGTAAGQTVLHAHVHVIPRYQGDVPDPRGGIRWVLAGQAPYWKD